MCRPFILLLACLSLLPPDLTLATPTTSLGIFEKSTVWKGPSVQATRPQPNLRANAPGIEFIAPMSRLDLRAFWETNIKLDLQKINLIQFDVKIDNPAAVKRFSIHFKSGAGWYGGWFNLDSPEWQTITIPRSSFHPEDSPAGWNAISGIRFSAWKQADIDTTIRIANMRGGSPLIGILLNSDAANHAPESHAIAERLSNRVAMWLEQEGMPPTILSDDELRANGVPEGIATMLLPFNPILTNGIPEIIENYVASGGRIIVAYTLDPKISALLGLKGKSWSKADPPGVFASIKFNRMVNASLPTIRQDSWNASIPEIDTASILATWVDADGNDTGIPAATLNSNGVFLGHILTNVDRQNKTQLLLSLASHLTPEAATAVNKARLASAQTLFEYQSWPQIHAYLEQTARAHNTVDATQRAIGNIEALRHSLTASGAEPDPRRTQELANRIESAYIAAIRPVNAAHNEFRGVWCHNARGLPGKNWSETAAAVKSANFNAIFANILWAGKAYYPSDYLPHALGTNDTTDYLQTSLTAAHQHGLEFHLWMVCWNITQAPDEFVEQMRQAGRLQHNVDGTVRRWLCPSHPENRRLSVLVAAEATSRYAIDGFHLDYIRYPDAQACYCDGCRERFQQQTGTAVDNWPADVFEGKHQAAYQKWRARLITSMVGTISTTLKRIRPEVKISAAVWPGWPAVINTLGQDWVTWIESGYLDFVCPMSYVTSASEAVDWFQKHQQFTQGKAPVYPGIAPTTHNLSPAEVTRQIDALRTAGAEGFMLFDLDPDLANKHLPAFKTGPTANVP